MKLVIFIGGTSHSGSTILDLLLSNHLGAMSLGEIRGLMKPRRPHHFEKRKELCSNDERWCKIIQDGKKHLYKNLVTLFDDKQFFIDSSKDPTWITYQQKRLRTIHDLEYRNVLIYKTPFEFAHSLRKRGLIKNWVRAWKHYYRFYFSMMDKYLIVSYKDVCTDHATLEKLRLFTEINFNSNKIITEQKNFFGSVNQNKLLHSDIFLKYKEIKDDRLSQHVDNFLSNDLLLKNIFDFLTQHNNKEISNNKNPILENIIYPFWQKEILKIKKLGYQEYRRYFPNKKWQPKKIIDIE